MMECQDPTQSVSALKRHCTNNIMPSKPKKSLSTSESVETKTEFGNSCAKDAKPRHQEQVMIAQRLPSNCENFEQSNLAMDHPSLSYSDNIEQKDGIASYKTVKHDVHDSTKEADSSSTPFSHSPDDEIKSVAGQLSPSIYESLWDGTIQLSNSVKVSAVAFFKSGEKNQDMAWPKIIEIKGKVKLEAFEKFVQEVSYSQNRSLMVISLCWKVGSSKAGLKGMKEVAKSFETSQKVGFAKICDGSGLYVCPRSEAIITILAKYGFFKGISAVDTNQDSLMGCIVWRRNPLLKNSDAKKSETRKVPPRAACVGVKSPSSVPCSDSHQAMLYSSHSDTISSRNTSIIQNSIEKIQEIQGTCMKTQDEAAGLQSRHGHGGITGERVHAEAVMPILPVKPASTIFLLPPQITPIKVPSLIEYHESHVSPLQVASHEACKPLAINPENQQHAQPITESHSGSLGVGHPVSHYPVMQNFTLALQPSKTDLHRLPMHFLDALQRPIHSDLHAEKSHMVEAFSGSMLKQKYASRARESSELQGTHPLFLQPDSCGAPRPDDKDDLPEFDFSTVSGAEVKPNVHPLNRESATNLHGPMHPKLSGNKSGTLFQQPHLVVQVETIKPCENVAAQGNFTNKASMEIMNPVSHSNTEAKRFRDKDGTNDEDMPEWHFPELDHDKLHKSNLREVTLPSSKTPEETPLGIFLPIPMRSHSPPKIKGFLHEHRPHMPPRCLNSLRDQSLFPRHPPVATEQGLFLQHPPALEDNVSFPQHLPVSGDQGSFPRHHPHVPVDQGLFPRHPPYELVDKNSVTRHPRHVPAGQGFIPRCPLADQNLFPRHHPRVLDQGSAHLHLPHVPVPGYFSSSRDHGNNYGHTRPLGSFAPPGAWRPIALHQKHEHHHFGSERSVSFSGSHSISGHHPSFVNGSGSRPANSGHR